MEQLRHAAHPLCWSCRHPEVEIALVHLGEALCHAPNPAHSACFCALTARPFIHAEAYDAALEAATKTSPAKSHGRAVMLLQPTPSVEWHLVRSRNHESASSASDGLFMQQWPEHEAITKST